MWTKVENGLPETNEKWSESEVMCCFDEQTSTQFTAWYDAGQKEWILNHFLAPSTPVRVSHWRKTFKNPKP